ncbi:MAG: hypothetical protein JO112_02685 [Planctomycetes bacterium]|nr:hypothetical protein [Planctomycetota bacterium]
MTFQEFLEKQAYQSHHKERRERREEWIAAVSRLMEQLRTWLAEADPAGVLEIVPMELEKAEPGLGSYRIPGLKINLGEAGVQVVPVGRNVVGIVGPQGEVGVRAEGRVDITDGIRRYLLYRTFKDGQEQWFALDEHFQAAPLDRGCVERILQDLLS